MKCIYFLCRFSAAKAAQEMQMSVCQSVSLSVSQSLTHLVSSQSVVRVG